MTEALYILALLGVLGFALWAFRKGGALSEAKAETRAQRAEIDALEATNETHDEIDGLSDDAVLERLRKRAESRE